jgi:hypothetical protein
MTAAALIESLKPGEVVIRCADGSLLRTVTNDFAVVAGQNPESLRKVMHKLTALKLRKKR